MTRRSSGWRVVTAVVIVFLGLLSRQPTVRPHLPPAVGESAGDTLWALLVFLLVRLGRPRWPTTRAGLVALGLAWAVEFSQLYHAPWLDPVRRTGPGCLVLGDTFVWSDVVCYAAGVALGVAGESVVRRVQKSTSRG